MRIDVLGVGFDDVTVEEAADRGMELMGEGGFHYAVTPNPEIVMAAEKDPAFREVLNGAHLVLPDGVGVVKAAKLLGRPLKGRCPGIDFAAALMERMAAGGDRLFLLGAKPGVAERAAENLRARYPGLTVCGIHDGYFTEDAPVVEKVKASGADVLFVCLGFPRQEFWMASNGANCGVKLAVGLGGSLDVFAGTVERAPEKWRRMGLEWLYRLYKEPRRIGRMAKLPVFLFQAAGARLRGR